MMKENRKKTSKVIALACAFALMVCSVAFFTDYVTVKDDDALKASAHTDTVKITVSDPDDADTKYEDIEAGLTTIWTANNAGTKLVAPGDHADYTFALNNDGEVDLDVRETIVLTIDEEFTDIKEFQMFTAGNEDATTSCMTGTTALTVENIATADGKTTVTYNVPVKTLDKGTSATYDYLLVFNRLSGNDFQGAKVTMDYLVEVKQATVDGWATVVDMENVTLTKSGVVVSGVLAK